MQVTSGGFGLTFRDEGEAADFARQLGDALRRGWGIHQAEPPLVLKTAWRDLDAALRAGWGRTNAQVNASRGPIGAAPGGIAPSSEQPDTLGTELAAKLANVHPRTLRKWIKGRLVEARRGPRGAYQVDVASLAAQISRSRTERNDDN
jgi:hypothetical protein